MSRPTVLVASRNAKKLAEMRRILAGVAPVDLVGLDDVAPYEEVPETGATFAENARIKAYEGARRTGLPTVADDSGLAVGALHGMPGVLSARWAGSRAGDRANLELLLEQLADVPDERRGAAFVCAVALVLPAGHGGHSGHGGHGEERVEVVHGRVDGTLLRAPRGDGGFGYDPVFVPQGETRTTAELAPQEKDALSHRGRALRALAPLLARHLGDRTETPGDRP